MNVIVKKSFLKGEIAAIGSKSYAHRYLLAASLSSASSLISNVPDSEDIKATTQCLMALGASLERNKKTVKVKPIQTVNQNPVLNCLESGSTLRFLVPVSLALTSQVTFQASPRLMQRGIEEYENIFKDQGIKIQKNESSIILEGNLKPGHFVIDGSLSSQFVTGLLFALPLLKGDSVIEILPPINSRSYIDITIAILKEFGIRVTWNQNQIRVPGNQKYIAGNPIVEGDYSNAAFLEAFNYFGNQIVIQQLNETSLQGDKVYQEYFRKLNDAYQEIDVANCIDLAPVLMAFAALKHGATFKNTARLALKESNRALAMKEELAKVGVRMTVKENEVILPPQDIRLESVPRFSSHNDHRIAMALSLFSVLGTVAIDQAEAIKKSYPDYFKDLETLGGEVVYE